MPHDSEPVLDPSEHDGGAWPSSAKADAVLDRPVEADALAGRRAALAELDDRLARERWAAPPRRA